MIIDHNHPEYRRKWDKAGANRYNGAFYYSKEIVKNIIPNVETDRNWITVNLPGYGAEHSILFVHNNLRPENYDWIKTYGFKDIVLVCGMKETVEKVAHLGKAIYLPLNIDVEYVEQFKVEEKTKDVAFVGRPAKRNNIEGIELPEGIDILEGMKRQDMLPKMAKYKSVYAVGRCALEAKVLGCRIRKYDPRYPKTSIWKVVDNREAAEMLQKMLNEIDD